MVPIPTLPPAALLMLSKESVGVPLQVSPLPDDEPQKSILSEEERNLMLACCTPLSTNFIPIPFVNEARV